MKQKLLLSGFVILFPKIIILLVLARLVFIVKAIKYSLLSIAFLCVLLVILACVSMGALLECCSNRFKESCMVIRMLLYSLAFFAVIWAAAYSIRNFRRMLERLLSDWSLLSTMIHGTTYKHWRRLSGVVAVCIINIFA